MTWIDNNLITDNVAVYIELKDDKAVVFFNVKRHDGWRPHRWESDEPIDEIKKYIERVIENKDYEKLM